MLFYNKLPDSVHPQNSIDLKAILGMISLTMNYLGIDKYLPDLSGIPDFFSGYGHHHISGSLNFIKIIFRIFLVRPFPSMSGG